MAYWLARQRNGQETDFIQRFDPRFWTVDFPRPMMGCVVTTAPDALRVDLECHHKDALAGLIWASEDTLDHPLLAYVTDRNYERTTLSFRWRSQGVLPLDAVDGPTLTIEGRDAGGAARSWFVRLWNYASGTPHDARITLPFGALFGGWTGDAPSEQVNPRDIDRMFISLPVTGYDPRSADFLPSRANAWVEMSEIACDGERAMLEIGDVMLPPHDIGMCTAYDDAYNQTPARLLRQMRGLGYRGEFVHYVGMSHYFRLGPVEADNLVVTESAALATPAEAWHRDLFERGAAAGYIPVVSLSYELLAMHCPVAWQQRDRSGNPALTGWEPPSALLSPANDDAMNFLRGAAALFAAMLKDVGAELHFQVGEPWWWIMPDGAPCIYDDAAKAALAIVPGDPGIDTLRRDLAQAETDLLDRAGQILADSTLSIRDTVRQVFGGMGDVRLLAFTPTVLAEDTPEQYRLNLPAGWAAPAFSRLQLEDYDWLTAGADALRRQAYEFVDARLGYPPDLQDYLAGFVLLADNADAYWRRIDAGLDEARSRNIERRFVWALPQVNRDGYTRLAPSREDDMQAFDDVLYPLALGRDTAVAPEFSTNVMVTASGHERRSSLWSDSRLHFDVGPGIRSENELGTLIAFFRARRGAARGFRLGDPFDFSSNGMTGTPTAFDQLLGTGDGLRADFPLMKSYGEADDPQLRPITRPRAATVLVSVDGVVEGDWTLEPGGIVRLASAPPEGAEVRAGFLFDVPVRFAEDRLDVSGTSFAAGEAPSVPLVEVREVR